MTSQTSFADTPEILAERYERAAGLMQGVFSKSIAFNATVFPAWIGDTNCFWYVRENKIGHEYRLVDAERSTNDCAFDHEALARALEQASGEVVHAENLALGEVEVMLEPRAVRFSAFGKFWLFNEAENACEEISLPDSKELASPDGGAILFRKDHNLWLRDALTGQERQLTQDGKPSYSYGSPGSTFGWQMGGAVQAAWSPDSKRIFTVQKDTRKVGQMPIVNFTPKDGSIRPTVRYTPVSVLGDEELETYRLVCIDAQSGKQQDPDHGPVISTRYSWYFFDGKNGWWGADSRTAYFVDLDRYYKRARVIAFDTATGECREIFEETSQTHINLQLCGSLPQFIPLPETSEILWYSQRSGWAHYYLYDLKTGALKNQVTSGPGLAHNAVCYVPKRRELFAQMASREKGRDPYYRNLMRVNIDTGEMSELASSDHDYIAVSKPADLVTSSLYSLGCPKSACAVSPSGDYAVVTKTRVDEAPESFVVDRNGEKIMNLEVADISGLPEGWRWPEPVSLVAADGKTGIYGVVYRPTDFDEKKSYPVISIGFHQPEFSATPKGAFTNGIGAGRYYLTAAALAELGFIVVQIDGRGAPEREKEFFDWSYGDVRKASDIDDHVAGIKQLAKKYPYMDLDRVGVGEILSGGSGALEGVLQHPDFFKAAVSLCQHDRLSASAILWGDEFEGPRSGAAHFNYTAEEVERLQAKLLLIHGLLDDSIFPTATLRLVDMLQEANKDFDMILLPNYAHAGREYGYLLRRSWDYFVKNLMGAEPPKSFAMPPLFTRHSFLKEKAEAAKSSSSK